MKKIIALYVLALGAVISAAAEKPKVIAHRGYWEIDGSAQNSIRSLVKADSVGCFASEFDVWMTADSVCVVNHDPKINGIVIETSPASVVLAQKLSNGENVPTLDAYLAQAAKLPIRIVCEMKTHNNARLEKQCIDSILALVKRYGLEDRVDYITFSKNGFVNFIKRAPKGTPVYFLNGDYIPEQVKFLKGAGIDYAFKVMKKHPDWIKRTHDLGMKVNVWTVNEPDQIQWCIDNGVDFITTNFPERVQQMIDAAPSK